jgi:uncharacterized protein (DUF2141 family)
VLEVSAANNLVAVKRRVCEVLGERTFLLAGAWERDGKVLGEVHTKTTSHEGTVV